MIEEDCLIHGFLFFVQSLQSRAVCSVVLKGVLSFYLRYKEFVNSATEPAVAQSVICEQTEYRENSEVRGHVVLSWVFAQQPPQACRDCIFQM